MTVGRIPVIEGGIQPTIFDAKADLLTATANDTPARLAVGSNFAFLQADSAQSTGLKWNLDTWTSYTPTVTAGSGSLTTASGLGWYLRIGKLCVLQLQAIITTNGTGATSIACTLPFTVGGSSTNYVGSFREMNVTGNTGVIRCGSGGTSAVFTLYNNGYPAASGYKLEGTVCFEVA
jgi:hypothetical protein